MLLDQEFATKLVPSALNGYEDGELFVESTMGSSMVMENGTLKNYHIHSHKGFGLRGIIQDQVVYAHSSDVTQGGLERASNTLDYYLKNLGSKKSVINVSLDSDRRSLYNQINPESNVEIKEKIDFIKQVERYLLSKDRSIKQMKLALLSNFQEVEIITKEGILVKDLRPIVRLSVFLILSNGIRIEQGVTSGGGRFTLQDLMKDSYWKPLAKKALKIAQIKLESIDAPAGEMPVVLGSGGAAVLLHEAVGHGLEGDANRKQSSAFSGLMGTQVASPLVTIIDDGTIPNHRGSLNYDDEGTPSSRNILIENGKLVGYMQDKMNSKLMGMQVTGNGRRESYMHTPMPRMTNTLMLKGKDKLEDLFYGIKKGVYAVKFAGGQVDTTSGNFVFLATESYLIEDGKLGAPLKDVTIIGNGPVAMKNVEAVANNYDLDDGGGTCGKAGQEVPVGMGQPGMRISSLTVGGTSL